MRRVFGEKSSITRNKGGKICVTRPILRPRSMSRYTCHGEGSLVGDHLIGSSDRKLFPVSPRRTWGWQYPCIGERDRRSALGNGDSSGWAA